MLRTHRADSRVRLRLRTILLVVNVVILLLPLGGIAILRIYENALIRQTESALIAQGAFIAATYRAALERVTGEAKTASDYGNPVGPALLPSTKDRWQPRAATLDLADSPIHPAPREATAGGTMDPLAALVGKELRPVLKDAQVVTLAGIRLLDSNGIVIASTGEELGKSLADREEVGRALRGEYTSVLRRRVSDEPEPPMGSISRGTSVRVFTTTPIMINDRVVGVAVLSRTPRNIFQALYGQRYPLIIGGVVLIFVVALITLFTSLTITRPIQGVVSQAKQAVDGELGSVTPLERPVTREVDELSRAVSTMAKTLEERAGYIRTFASHVSHEFKTPLTAIQGAIELLRDHAASMPSEDRERFLGNIDADAKRLERLVNQLLELAHADMIQPGADERADVSTAIEHVRARYDEKELMIEVENPTEGLAVGMDEETLESILSSLLDNVLRHGGKTATISVDHQFSEQSTRISVHDDGSGVSVANAPRVFEPFFTTGRKAGGTGLGLAIVRALLRAHKGDIRLAPSTTGTTFELLIPTRSSSTAVSGQAPS